MPEILNIPVVLGAIRTNDKYSEEFIAAAPDIKADIISFKDNPNCGCRRKIIDYVNKNKDGKELKDLFSKWIIEIPDLFIEVNPNSSSTVKILNDENVPVRVLKESPANVASNPPKHMMGHVVEIPADPNEYKNLLGHSLKERWMYRGLTVMSKDDKWLVFFY